MNNIIFNFLEKINTAHFHNIHPSRRTRSCYLKLFIADELVIRLAKKTNEYVRY